MPHQRADPDDFSNVAGWRCPLCNSERYSQIEVARATGLLYKTEFYQCSGCSVMFRYPGRFTRLGLAVRRWASDVEPRSLREVHTLAAEQKDKTGS